MQLLEHELARRSNGRLELREQPLRVRWTFDQLVTSDGHAARCAFECSVRALPDPTERRMLQEVLLDGRQTLTADEVSAHFHRQLRTAAEGVVGGTAVADALSDGGRKAALDAL